MALQTRITLLGKGALVFKKTSLRPPVQPKTAAEGTNLYKTVISTHKYAQLDRALNRALYKVLYCPVY